MKNNRKKLNHCLKILSHIHVTKKPFGNEFSYIWGVPGHTTMVHKGKCTKL